MNSRTFMGRISSISNDKGPFTLVKITADGKERVAELISAYGSNSVAPVGSRCMCTEMDGDEGKLTAFAIDDPAQRFDSHKEGEVRMGNTMSGSSVLLTENGDKLDDVKGDNRVKISGNHEQSIDGDESKSVKGSITNEADGDVIIRGATVHINP